MAGAVAKGSVFANRFDIDCAAGAGGMGAVYRARDRYTGDWIALKLLHTAAVGSPEVERFAREASLLEELRHPGIVAHVAHGQTPDGQCFLAMQWLDGEDLSQRLLRGPLSISDSILLLKRAAEALAAIHALGVIHRDIKPANLFLRDYRIERVTLLDFGIARRAVSSRSVTRTGLVIGTPEYMAPEQARGARDVGPTADIFSLGCVLYECLTGQPPFVGEHVAAVLVRILLEEPLALGDHRPGLPAPLVSLVGRMLAKDPAGRPPDALALLDEIDALRLEEGRPEPLVAETLPGPTLTAFADGEQALFSVVVASSGGMADPGDASSGLHVATGNDEQRATLSRALEGLVARVVWLFDGSLVATLAGASSATDQAVQAARAALLIKARWPEADVALATGCGSVRGMLPVGEAVDRAAKILSQRADADSDHSSVPARPSGVWLDELSAGLLARRYALEMVAGSALLSGVELSADESRLLLGKPTLCVGREQELGVLDALLSGCVEESEAQAVLVTAPPGVGKTRLRHELLRRIEARGEGVTILLGRGEMMTSGSPYAILSSALRGLSCIGGGEPPEAQRAAVEARLGRRVAPPDRRRVIEFLGELAGVPFPDSESPLLRAARSDPKIMSDQLAEAFIDFLRAECANGPVLLVLEDLHWGDAMTVKLIAAGLRQLDDQPLMVLALARPDVHKQFPKLWASSRLREISLSGLSKKASERLIQQALGKDVPAETVARIVEQAAGNALFLEELIRAQIAGKDGALPETVLAMLQARIGRLEASARRTLRAASVFGLTFWRKGLASLLGVERSRLDIDGALHQLVEAELIEIHKGSRFAGDLEYGFRHALIREASYGLLADEDRRLGHRLAGDYLEKLGEPDALVLAEHFKRGQVTDRAAVHYLRAGSQSFDRNDLDGALDRAERGIACGAQGETLGNLRVLAAMAHCWRSEMEAGYRMSTAALELVRRTSRWECMVLFHGTWSSLVLGQEEDFAEMARRLASLEPDAEALHDYLLWCPLAASLLTSYGRSELARELLDRVERFLDDKAGVDLFITGAQAVGRSDYVRAFEPGPYRQFLLTQQAVRAFEQIGDRRNQVTALSRLGQAESELGDPEAGERTLREAVAMAKRIGVPFAVRQAELHLAALLCKCASPSSERRAEGRAIAEAVLGAPGVSAGYQGWARGILAQATLTDGAFDDAERQARSAVALCASVPLRKLWVTALLVRSLIHLRRAAEVTALAAELTLQIERLGGAGYVEVDARLAAAEAYEAAGDRGAAQAALQAALNELRLRAESIPELPWRERYLERVTENARVLALAREWLVGEPRS